VVLIAELRQARWFGGKSRVIQHTRVIDRVNWVDDSELSLVEVQYAQGAAETYVLAERSTSRPWGGRC